MKVNGSRDDPGAGPVTGVIDSDSDSPDCLCDLLHAGWDVPSWG